VDNLLQKLPRKWVVIDTYLIPRERANLSTLYPIIIREAGRLLEGLRGEDEPLLGDKGYDSQRNLELASEHGFKPVIKPRTIKYHGIFRKQMLREFKRCRGAQRLRNCFR